MTATSIDDLKIKIFADGADLDGMKAMAAKPWIKGLTTNPTLMRKAGVTDYPAFARRVLDAITDKPISFEVFADDADAMTAQGRVIGGWGPNVNVKIPVTNTRREFAGPLISRLSQAGVALNITAIMTVAQVRAVVDALRGTAFAYISVFAGRIADTGVDPMPIMRASGARLAGQPKAELLWASVREVLNLFQAQESGCAIVTVPHDILAKAEKMLGFDLTALSLDTVKMFAKDAAAAGFQL